MIRDETWSQLRARSKAAGFWDEVLSAKQTYVDDGYQPKDAKRKVLEDYAATEAGASAPEVAGERAAPGTGFGIEQDPTIWKSKPKISHTRAVE